MHTRTAECLARQDVSENRGALDRRQRIPLRSVCKITPSRRVTGLTVEPAPRGQVEAKAKYRTSNRTGDEGSVQLIDTLFSPTIDRP
jgi:hypothetical protein